MHHDEVARALTGEFVSVMRWRGSNQPSSPPLDSISRGTRIRVFVAVPIVSHERVIGSVLLARTPGNIRQAIYGKRRELTQGALVLLAVIVAIALVTSLTIGRPVRALRDQARRAARGEQGAVTPLRNPGTREIAELSETVAEMARTLETRANYIGDFAAHVSHEFKTPLTALQGAVEMLREHGATMSAEERTRFLDILERDTKRLAQLVRRLLELARADMTPAAAAETADVGTVLEAAAGRYRDTSLHVQVEAPMPPLQAAIAADTLESILGSLLDNVRTHAGPQAAARLSAIGAGTEVDIFVRDNGPGISPANQPRVFEPFFTTAREQGGTGLGLSIARSLTRAHGGDLELVPSDDGAVFRLRLPLAQKGDRTIFPDRSGPAHA
jgi:signal transduction histidine kinase